MPKILRGGEYRPEEQEKFKPVETILRGCRIYGETLQKVHDNPEHWAQMLELNYGIVMGNRIYDLLKFISAQFFN